MYLRPKGIDVALARPKSTASLALDFVGSAPGAYFVASDQLEGYSNYILGADPSRWLTRVPHFGRVTYHGIYPGVDAAFYGNGLTVEHDFIVEPGADYRSIRIHVTGPTKMDVQPDGSLRLLFPDGKLAFEKPQVYQVDGNCKIKRKGRFALLGERDFGFVVGKYDNSKPLIIDPVLSYSTYLADLSVVMGGVATDATGNTFLTGLVFSPNFPVTPGVYQASCKSCTASIQQPDVFISKINASGTALLYSTYLGGSGYDQPFGIAVDASGNAVVVGRTESTDFPTRNPIAVGTAGNGTSYGFISSLSSDGSALNYSSILGGGAQPFQSSSTVVGGVALDSNGNAYIAGTTDSPVFPTTPGALSLTAPAYPKTVVFVSKFLKTGALGYSALLGDTSPQNGGGGPIGVFGIAVDAMGSVYIAGSSGTLWPTTQGSFQSSIPGATPYAAPFVTKLSASGAALAYSTFLGDGGYATGITVKPATGEAFVTGQYSGSSSGNNFPTTPNAYEPTIGSGCCASFLTEFSADGSRLLYSSYFSGDRTGASNTITSGVALDGANNIWVSGSTTSLRFPLRYPLQSLPGATQTGFPSTTAFLSRFDSTGASLTFSSYAGGTVQGGTIAGVAIDGNNHAHVGGTTGDGLFTTPGAYRSSVTPAPQFVQYTFGYAAVIDADTAAPSLCLDLQGLFFGAVRVGSSQTQTLTITNCGNAPLNINSVQPSNPVFTIPAGSNNCTQSIAINASCAVTVDFSPTTTGQVSGTLTISSNASISTASIAVQGTGALPQISLQTSSVTFDPQFVGQTSPQQFVFVSNAGSVPLNINLAQTTISPNFAFTQSGCDQPIGTCLFLLTFTPTRAGVLTGTLQIASDDPANPVVSVPLGGTGYDSYPTPKISYLSSPTIPIGSTQVSLQVYGSNFFPASVIQVGGVVQSTTYQSSTVLTAAVDSSLLATLGELPVTVFTPSPGGGITAPLTITVYQSIPLAARAMVYDPFSRLLFASVEATAANHPNTIAVIDPAAGNINQFISVGNNPRMLAVSDDGKYLYVALDGDHAIQRISLNTLTIEKTFALPVDPSFGLLTVGDMKVVPGSPQSVVTALFRVASPAEDGIALFNDAGLVNWLGEAAVNDFLPVDSFAFAGNPPVVYSYPLTMGNAPGSFGTFGVFTIDSSGIHVQTLGSVGGAEGVVASDGKLLYTNWGQVWNPPALVGTYSPALSFGGVPSVVPDDSLTRTFFLNTFSQYNQYQATSVDAYDQNTFAFAGTVPFLSTSVYGPNAVGLNRWGTDGFAFVVGDFSPVTGSNQIIIFRSSVAHAPSDNNPVPTVSALSVSTVTAGGPAFVLTVQGTGFVRGSVVQWNGNARETNFVSPTQLSAQIPASDIAQAGTAQITALNSPPGGGISSSLTLTINPPAPVAAFQPAALTFDSQTVGTQSAAQTVTLQNTGGSALAVNSIQTSGDFAETNNCPVSLAAGASCAVSVTFTPSATGTRQATLVFADNSANSPQTITLSGVGANPNFSFGSGSSTSTTATVTAGQTATYSLSIVSASGSSGMVTLTCTQVPANAICTPNPASLTLTSGGNANFTVTVSTGSLKSALWIGRSVSTATTGIAWFLSWLLFRRRYKAAFLRCRIWTQLLAVAVLASAFVWVGCGGGGGSTAPPPSASGLTPQGTYTLQIVATQGATTHSQPITLVVQ